MHFDLDVEVIAATDGLEVPDFANLLRNGFVEGLIDIASTGMVFCGWWNFLPGKERDVEAQHPSG